MIMVLYACMCVFVYSRSRIPRYDLGRQILILEVVMSHTRKICKEGLIIKGNYVIITLFRESCLKPRIVPPYVPPIIAMVALRTLVQGLFFSTFFLGGS
jgi:hypothetical protein